MEKRIQAQTQTENPDRIGLDAQEREEERIRREREAIAEMAGLPAEEKQE